MPTRGSKVGLSGLSGFRGRPDLGIVTLVKCLVETAHFFTTVVVLQSQEISCTNYLPGYLPGYLPVHDAASHVLKVIKSHPVLATVLPIHQYK